jgi:hypothetical protein
VEEWAGANISKGRNRRNGQTYWVGRLAIVAEMSRSHAKADHDDDGVGQGWGKGGRRRPSRRQ